MMRVELGQEDDLEVDGRSRWPVEPGHAMKETDFVEFHFRQDGCLEKADGIAGQLSAVCVKSFAHLWESGRRKMIALESKGRAEVGCFHSLR